jgi:ABC-type sugar transport system substrate-binding protein
MRHAKYVVILVILSFTFALHLSAQDAAPLTIGFAQVGSESEWRIAFTNATLAEAEARGINLIFSDGENSQDTQIAALRSFIEQDVDAIILAPVVETGWDQVLQEVQDAGIPLIVIDRNVTSDPSLYLTRVASDFVHEGRLAAAWLAQESNGNCTIIELEGTVGSSAARDRQIGFNSVIDLFPNMQIILSQSGNFTREGGREIMEAILQTENMDLICALWAHNDDMAIGAIQAMQEYGVDPGDDILIVSVDAIPEIFQYMVDSETNATVELSPYMASPAFDAVVAHLNGEEIPKLIPVLGAIYLPDTAAEELEKRTQ